MKCSWDCVDLGHRMGLLGDMMMEARTIAALLGTKVSFDFNGVKVILNENTSVLYNQQVVLDAVQSGKKKISVCS